MSIWNVPIGSVVSYDDAGTFPGVDTDYICVKRFNGDEKEALDFDGQLARQEELAATKDDDARVDRKYFESHHAGWVRVDPANEGFVYSRSIPDTFTEKMAKAAYWGEAEVAAMRHYRCMAPPVTIEIMEAMGGHRRCVKFVFGVKSDEGDSNV